VKSHKHVHLLLLHFDKDDGEEIRGVEEDILIPLCSVSTASSSDVTA
jgi:hypothetical protein